jgi:hypothetical protein
VGFFGLSTKGFASTFVAGYLASSALEVALAAAFFVDMGLDIIIK